jgi:hypothetical protein
LCFPEQRYDKISRRCKIKILRFESKAKAKSIKERRERGEILEC